MSNNNQHPRIKFIAYLQIIGIILVVFGHSLHEYPTPFLQSHLYRTFTTFRMPLFIFVSGFLMYLTSFTPGRNAASVSDFTIKKCKRLLLPYLVLATVAFMPRSLLSFMADDNVELSWNAYFRSLLFPEDMTIIFFWFVQASFILLTLTYLLITLSRRMSTSENIPLITLLIIFLIYPFLGFEMPTFFSINRVADLGFYFVLGCLYCKYTTSVDKVIPWTSPWLFIVSFIIWGGAYLLLPNKVLNFVCGLAGISMCISLTKMMVKHNIKWLDHLVGANYIIFLLSWFCNMACQQVLSQFTDFPWWVYTILSLVSGIYIPWLGYKYLQRHYDSRWVKVTAFLLGQNIKPKRT